METVQTYIRNQTQKSESKKNKSQISCRSPTNLESSKMSIKKKEKIRRLGYQRCVKANDNILIRLLSNKRSEEHIEGKPQSQKHSNSHHLRKDFSK